MPYETIAAISTPHGPGAIGMVRLSGTSAFLIAEKVFCPNAQPALVKRSGYTAVPGRIFKDGKAVDDAVAILYRAPKSYTGENMVELCCHGGHVAVGQLLALCIDNGAIPAPPGEFTKRAFLNGKLDLSQAEAVSDMIGAQGEDAMRAAYAAREGALAQKVNHAASLLLDPIAHIAAWSDYPEEDLAPVDEKELMQSMVEAASFLEPLLETYGQGKLLKNGIATAIVGKPNVGKSTLMNLLAGEQRSIVTEIPGTTRDIVTDTVSLGGISLRLMDTAGIRETKDAVEQIGVDRALAQLETADLILAVFDRSESMDQSDRALLERFCGKRVVAVLNKNDLPAVLSEDEIRSLVPEVVSISAKTGEGRNKLEETIRKVLALNAVDTSAAILFHERQRRCIAEAIAALREGMDALDKGMTLDAVNVCMEAALDHLLSLTGKRVSEAVVHEIFARFCVGK